MAQQKRIVIHVYRGMINTVSCTDPDYQFVVVDEDRNVETTVSTPDEVDPFDGTLEHCFKDDDGVKEVLSNIEHPWKKQPES